MIFLQAGRNQVSLEGGFKEDSIRTNHSGSVFISESPIMQILYEKIKDLAFIKSPILILGAKGTGRTTAAFEIFNKGENKQQRRLINFFCYDLDQHTIESRLFGKGGHEKGLLNSGINNTLFIKGIECFKPALQEKFLYHLINHKKRETSPRLICAASENLSKMVKENQFSQHIFEILSQNLLILPLLSERQEDIPVLVSLFNKQNAFKGRMTEQALRVLKHHFWKENVKELKDVCFKVSILHSDKEFITKDHLPIKGKKSVILDQIIKYNPSLTLEDIINHYIQMSLEHFQSKQASARALGISVKTIYNKIKTGCVAFSD